MITLLCFVRLPLLLSAQTVVWCVTKGSSSVPEDVAFSTSTAVTVMMIAGTSVMRGGACSGSV